ncbi:MAG: hypothetical protein Rpha_1158 [Candidatus Ruthia sp. Apha_13_S6]|nr:hypothetical protein [Candidatus Ruthia sp. Apha_13_S6]
MQTLTLDNNSTEYAIIPMDEYKLMTRQLEQIQDLADVVQIKQAIKNG